MKSTVVKRSIILAGHKTSVSLEDAFWEGLKDIAKTKRKTLSELVGGIDIGREHAFYLQPGRPDLCSFAGGPQLRLTLTSQGWLAPHTRLIGTSLFYARLYLAHRFKKCAGPNSVPTIHRLQKQPRAEHRSGLRPTKSIDGIVGTTGRRGVSGGAEIPGAVV